MLLRVIYTDGSFDIVNQSALRTLIESCKVAKFKRSDGWVDIGSPHVRGIRSARIYSGPERRDS